MVLISFILAFTVSCVLGDQCTDHVSNGKHGIGCVDNGCCQYTFQIANLCAGDQVCCFSTNTCGGSSGGTGAHDCYGTIDNLDPRGKANGGVAASHSDVDYRINELNALKACFVEFANTHCIEAALLAGIASRETQAGALLDSRGYGDNGHGYGIMQCDIRYSGIDCTQYGPRSCEHLQQMSQFLIGKINDVKGTHPNWTKDQQLQGGVAAYNHFPQSSSFANVDFATTGHDYSNDVIARAKWLKDHYNYQ